MNGFAASARPWISSVAILVVIACGPSVSDDDTGGGSGGGSGGGGETGNDGGSGLVDGSGGEECESVLGCDAWRATVTGACRPVAYAWDGYDCVQVSGCECTGTDCCHLTATRDECYAKFRATCEDLPVCFTCEDQGQQCVYVCDHVGTLWMENCVERDFQCTDGGWGSAPCMDAPSFALECVY